MPEQDTDLLPHRCGNCNKPVRSLTNGLCDECHVQTVVNAPDNVAMPAQPPLAPGQIALNVTPDGLTIQIMPVPIGLGLGKDGMRDIVRQWLATDPELANELLQVYIATLREAKSHLALVKDPATVRQINKKSKLVN